MAETSTQPDEADWGSTSDWWIWAEPGCSFISFLYLFHTWFNSVSFSTYRTFCLFSAEILLIHLFSAQRSASLPLFCRNSADSPLFCKIFILFASYQHSSQQLLIISAQLSVYLPLLCENEFGSVRWVAALRPGGSRGILNVNVRNTLQKTHSCLCVCVCKCWLQQVQPI